MSGRVVHVAGLDVVFGGHLLRQRCAWCGAILIDLDARMTAVALPPGKSEEQARSDGDLALATWPVGALIAVDGAAAYVVAIDEDAQVPDDCCMALDPEVTR